MLPDVPLLVHGRRSSYPPHSYLPLAVEVYVALTSPVEARAWLASLGQEAPDP